MTGKHRNSFENNTESDTDTHDLLVKTYLEYFTANENFEKRCSWRTRWRSRQLLKEISLLAEKRRKEIYNIHKAKLKVLDEENPEASQIRRDKNGKKLSSIKKDNKLDGKQE